MAEGLVAGAWALLGSLAYSRPAVAQHQIELGCLSLAVAELRTMDSSEWVHVSRSPLGLPTSVFNMLGVVFTSLPDAVEGAEVILYGVSKRYKESANCRLEANYGHQQE